jgi:hypothetical protein
MITADHDRALQLVEREPDLVRSAVGVSIGERAASRGSSSRAMRRTRMLSNSREISGKLRRGAN